jgi:HK97 gp10 family phage protein
MIKVTVSQSDLNRIQKKLSSADARMTKAAQTEITRTAFAIETGAKRRCPVDEGRLRSSIRTDLKKLAADIGTNVEYAPFVEFGTVKQRAQPYLFPAYEQERKKMIKNLKTLLKI